jgi:protein-disulfide isomerase/DNA-directed RNA polymerase subunit F
MRQGMLYRLTIFWALLFLKMLGPPVTAQTCAKCEPLAEVEGETITSSEVEKILGARLAKLEEQLYAMKQQALDALIGERLLAQESAKRNISVQALLDSEVTAKVAPVTESEIETIYQKNKSRLKGEEATLRDQIRVYLQNQNRATRREAFLQSLRSQAKVVVHLRAPSAFWADVAVEGAPFRGLATAPVTIVEFSDFHCQYCKQVQTSLAQLLSRYSDKVKLVYRNFPIDSLHPGARKAAQAAQCAKDQGKFWAYHDKLYASEPDASPEKLKAFAEEVGLDLSGFEGCLSSGKYQAIVEKDIEEITRLGVTGTPAFFINGRLLSGTHPLETFVRAVEEELARMK